MKADFIRARIEPHLKAEVHAVLDAIGITPTQAITIFYKQIQLRQGLPFEVAVPKAKMAKALKKARRYKNLLASKDANDRFKKLSLKR